MPSGDALRKGVYTTNGSLFAIMKRATRERALPDLFCFPPLTLFTGYFPELFGARRDTHTNYLTLGSSLRRTRIIEQASVTLTIRRSAGYTQDQSITSTRAATTAAKISTPVVAGIKFVRG